ncbi:MAG TPA: thiamine pyrophosphate-binding protein [Alphaproteobacteria bacterium]|nr:thiamine pyrophosphate-binding protein [Alphaproteobacteria bacterium]HAJ45472.1 thiamine pyrophosphate-binding protein [Alphaproteobacteria bacterium]
MSSAASRRLGGQCLVDQIALHGTEIVFAVPGESYLAALEGLYHRAQDVRVITCRHEAGAANMAEAYGKLTGRPGIAFVTRGPGTCHATIGLHTAFQDSTPMILFIGQVARDQVEREAFQEIDYRRMLGQVTKWTAEIPYADRIPEFVSRAYHMAVSGRPGPVALALPEDMLTEYTDAGDMRHFVRAQSAPRPQDMTDLTQMLMSAERPLAVLGGPGWTPAAAEDMRVFLEAWGLPAVTSFRAKDRLDNRHPLYAGDMGIGIDPQLNAAIGRSDLLVVIGARLGEMTTDGYTRVAAPVPAQALVHVHPGADELNRVYQASLSIPASVEAFAAAARALKPASAPRWRAWAADLRGGYERWIQPVTCPGAVNPSQIFHWLNTHLPEDAILTNGAGNYAGWAHRFFLQKRLGTQLAPTSGAMGYGLPAAVAAKAIHPERTVVALAGDGCFMMAVQELATAVQHELAIIVLVFNNNMYGTIRMHQERHYPAHVSATSLRNPDFAAMAESYGALGLKVTRTEDFEAAFKAAQAAGRPALIELAIDPEAITPTTTLSAIRAKALQAKEHGL